MLVKLVAPSVTTGEQDGCVRSHEIRQSWSVLGVRLRIANLESQFSL